MESKTFANTNFIVNCSKKGKSIMNNAKIGGMFKIECHDKDGNLKWEDYFKNGWVNTGLLHLMDRSFKSSPPSQGVFYLGIISGTPTLDPDDTIASHPGWTEITNYIGNRQLWGQGDPVENLGVVSSINAVPVTFVISQDNITIGGCMVIANEQTKGGTSGILIAHGVFSAGNKLLDTDDTISITYELKIQAV